MEPLAVTAAEETWRFQAQQLAEQLQLPFAGCTPAVAVEKFEFVLERGDCLQLCATGRKAPGPVLVEFVNGNAAYRRKSGGGKGQQIARATGVRSGFYPQLVDATAGLGRDAFVLASLGCAVQMFERNPLVHALLSDGLRRLTEAALEDTELALIAGRLSLQPSAMSAAEWLAEQPEDSIQVVYLDPMFPGRDKSAKVKKEMAIFHRLVGNDDDAAKLLAPAQAACVYRTVVKRPRLAPLLANAEPTFSLEGKSCRFDIYTKKGLPK
ncbi:MAG: class I SAM-dependent methyltransferase [Gammaproteobacteria bacterium]|nr:class I SAM-dependent methyltransferase [Gammaproteobacteria bacterium]